MRRKLSAPVLVGLLAWVGFCGFIIGLDFACIVVGGGILFVDIARHSAAHTGIAFAALAVSGALSVFAATGNTTLAAVLFTISRRKTEQSAPAESSVGAERQ